jgi:C-terminal processing protease CtpA/Prc
MHSIIINSKMRVPATVLLFIAAPAATLRVLAESPSAGATEARASAPTRRVVVDQLDQAALQEIFHLLRQNYVQRNSLTLLEMNRAALEGMLERLDFGAEIVPLGTPANPPPPGSGTFTLVTEVLTSTIGYLRPATFSPDEISAVDAALKTQSDAKVTTLILDLRCPAPHGEFSTAAQLADRFLRADLPLFSVRQPAGATAQNFRSQAAEAWSGRLVVLVDEESNNVAETVAAVLRDKLHPQMFGTPTRGRTMEYQEAPISPAHKLRFASAEMILPDGTSLFRKGLAPNVLALQDIEKKHKIFLASQTDGVKKFISSTERPRVNERALVTRTSPELDYHIAKAGGRKTEFDEPPLHDRVLQQAVDVLMARDFLDAPPP